MNTLPRLLRSPASGAASAFSPVGAVAAGAQIVTGLVQAIGGSKQMKAAKAKRKAYEIPDEIYDILNASMNQMGGDAQTLNYETNQIEQAGAAGLGVAARMGADPNMLSSLFGQQVTALGGAAQRNHATAMENFGRVISGYNLLAENKAAKWKSEQDIVKDDMQAANEKMKAGMGNVAGGVNTAISVDSAARAGNLYRDRTIAMADALKGGTAGVGTTPPVVTPALQEALGSGSGNQWNVGSPFVEPVMEALKANKLKTFLASLWRGGKI